MNNWVQNKTQRTIQELNYYTNLLYMTPCIYTRNVLLHMVRDRLNLLNELTNINTMQEKSINTNTPIMPPLSTNDTFTIEELSEFNGQNGKPAYIAVNNTVYDVTNNAAWAAASHFGLSAGTDVTDAFASCHAGQQQILDKLKVVGRLV